METKKIYSLRNSFSIIGLTGKTGSGCTIFSKLISKDINSINNKMLRRPDEINYIKNLQDKNTVFKRKYTICYNYFQTEPQSYKTISYISVILFYVLHYSILVKKAHSKKQLIDLLNDLILKNFKKTRDINMDSYKAATIERKQIESLELNYDAIIKLFKQLKLNFKEINHKNEYELLYNCFFEKEFTQFADSFYKLLGGTDYVLGSLFVHRIGNKIRATGNPFEERDLKEHANPEYIYSLVYVINKLVKAWKTKNDSCHICIDSLRNSLEIMFLKERYSGFYMAAIHNEGRHKDRIAERIMALRKLSKSNSFNETEKAAELVLKIDEIERNAEDFKKGFYFAPDVENCIQKSEIHINNPGKYFPTKKNRVRDTSFYSMIEQWVRIKSLISHPGIVTPTHEERCMQIAYNSKFNSGCISRQVGAVITDKNHSIRSVGWNDVPKGSIPCNIRTLVDIINPQNVDKENDKSYSDFELAATEKPYKYGGNFAENTKILFSKHIELTQVLGLNHSFCFKSLHNKYERKDNQVHTRSLHAEENAMLQISKYGGQPLHGGTLYTTASPCELCAKKAYQLGIKSIVYIDPYPGISMEHILKNGYKEPKPKMFSGIIGKTYNKLFEPFLSYKDELSIITSKIKSNDRLLENNTKEFIEANLDVSLPDEIKLDDIIEKLKELK